MTTEQVRTVGDKYEADADCPAFYFDIAPLLDRCPNSMRQPDRLKLICENCVARVVPLELVLFREGGFFLVVQSCTGTAAEGLARAVNIALVKHFFGTESLEGNDLEPIYRRVGIVDIASAGFDVSSQLRCKVVACKDLDRAARDPLVRLAENGVPGCDDLRLAFQAMYNVQRGAASAFFCGPSRQQGGQKLFGAAALGAISAKDRPMLDEAVLEYALSFVRKIVPGKAPSAIGVSVSYETLAWSRGRQMYQNALRTANVAENPFLIVKVDDIPVGTPVTRLAEIVSTIRPFVKRVFVQLPDCDFGLMQSGIIGVAGLSVVMPPNATLTAIARVVTRLKRTAGAQNALACLENVDRPSVLALIRSSGVRFASGLGCDKGCLLEEPTLNASELVLNCAGDQACA